MAKRATVSLVEKMRFRARTGSGQQFTIDAGPDVGGEDGGSRPMDLVLTALAGCGAMDVISILRKMRAKVSSYEVEAIGETAAEHPRRYTSIVLTHLLAADHVSEANVRRAIFLSMSRYCPVFSMLAPTVPITVRYEISDVGGQAIASGDVGLADEVSG